MARFIKDISATKGQAPGSLIFIGDQKIATPIIKVMEYDTDSLIEKELTGINEGAINTKAQGVTWINIFGIHDIDMIQKMGELFEIHPLLLEDILNTDQRPKYLDKENHNALILNILQFNILANEITAEQITIILGQHFVLTLHESQGDIFEPVRERIRNKKSKARLNESDYLAYALLDTIVDNYIILIETIGRKVEDLEDRIFSHKDAKIAEEIYNLKTELNFLRKSIRPVGDLMIHLFKSEHSLFKKKNFHYLKDLSELVIHAIDVIELYSNMVSDQLSIYNANLNSRMNEVMRVLTIFASIFIPLTFFAGVYGMNFSYFPEIEFKYSYPLFWLVTLSIIVSLIFFFRKRKWF
ncbi:magnesium/cobalt transporter CorA [Maribellus comscasis]|uniref:Magnesium transport protein CorA n=1 Tax=Maribellus comscasis TaxID=2681766 RepID=A0A6I6K110_9BACT|nr:magnesium/cobalt transporter CorA [Maribellus comscasis]QGY46102.1 magnesium/cobalt transporter CorA [Maribellus comscasis]